MEQKKQAGTFPWHRTLNLCHYPRQRRGQPPVHRAPAAVAFSGVMRFAQGAGYTSAHGFCVVLPLTYSAAARDAVDLNELRGERLIQYVGTSSQLIHDEVSSICRERNFVPNDAKSRRPIVFAD